MIDFIGLGAQKSGTSWAYTSLYEHPQVCIPVKEIHFFSRPRYETEGIPWYEDHFKKCGEGKIKGEWSTSYLYSKETPERIFKNYPKAKLLAIVRNPLDRGYSEYRNTIRSGEITEAVSFETFCEKEKSVWEQGLYMKQLDWFLKFFPREQILVMVYEDIQKDPVGFMRTIYEFLEIDPDFISSMLYEKVNIARTPRIVAVDRVIHHISEFLRKNGFDHFVHVVRKSGITNMIRTLNSKKDTQHTKEDRFDASKYKSIFTEDVTALSAFLGRDMHKEWNI